MPTAPSIARPSRRARSKPTSLIGIAVLVAAGIAVAVVAMTALREPSRVDVTIENPTDFDFNVRVSPADGGSSLGLGQIPARSTEQFRDVNDQGEEWLIELSYGGVEAGEMTVSGSSIESTPIVVPDSAAEALRRAGFKPPP